MKLDRRAVLGLGAALLAGARAVAQPSALAGPENAPDQSSLQAAIAPFWGRLARVPHIRHPAREVPSAGFCYMFTNKDCEICQIVHKEYPEGYRWMEMRYIIYPWLGEPVRELNHMYRPEATLAEFRSYMAHDLGVLSLSDSRAQADLVMRVADEIAAALVEGGGFGTPFFLHARPGTTGKLLFSAGDVVAMAPLLDSAA